jgi:hypothetical protein
MGSAAHKKVAEALGIFCSKGKPSWGVVTRAGGVTSFKGASAQGSAALVAKGVANARDSMATSTAVRVDLIQEAQNIETDRFERILTTSDAMPSAEVQASP